MQYYEDGYEPSIALLSLSVTFDRKEISWVKIVGAKDGIPLEVNGSKLEGDELVKSGREGEG